MINSISKTIISSNGKTLFHKLEHFIEDIIIGNSCFICGAKPESKQFNNEHIIPEWILRKYNLFDQRIVLPNKTKIPYSKYKVPCCLDCNSELGETYEKPISQLFEKSSNEVIEILNKSNETKKKVFTWLCLIFFKTHLKDTQLRQNLDFRQSNNTIGERYNWADFHHLHCVVRSHFTGAKIHSKVIGSMYFNKVIQSENKFDYIDNSFVQGVLLQLGDFCICSILNDSNESKNIYKLKISKIIGLPTLFQFYEVFANLNYINLYLEQRAQFQSIFDYNLEYRIIAKRPKKNKILNVIFRKHSFGKFLRIYIERSSEIMEFTKDFLDEIEKGNLSFLWSENGEFIDPAK